MPVYCTLCCIYFIPCKQLFTYKLLQYLLVTFSFFFSVLCPTSEMKWSKGVTFHTIWYRDPTPLKLAVGREEWAKPGMYLTWVMTCNCIWCSFLLNLLWYSIVTCREHMTNKQQQSHHDRKWLFLNDMCIITKMCIVLD